MLPSTNKIVRVMLRWVAQTRPATNAATKTTCPLGKLFVATSRSSGCRRSNSGRAWLMVVFTASVVPHPSALFHTAKNKRKPVRERRVRGVQCDIERSPLQRRQQFLQKTHGERHG